MKEIDPTPFPDTSVDDFPQSGSMDDHWTYVTEPDAPDYSHQAFYYPGDDASLVISIVQMDPSEEWGIHRDHAIVVWDTRRNRIEQRLIAEIDFNEARDICCGITVELDHYDIAGDVLDELDIDPNEDTDWQDHYTVVERTDLRHYGFKPSDNHGTVFGVEHDERPFAVLAVKNERGHWESRIYRYRSQYVSDVIDTHDSKREVNEFLEDWLDARPDGVDITRL